LKRRVKKYILGLMISFVVSKIVNYLIDEVV